MILEIDQEAHCRLAFVYQGFSSYIHTLTSTLPREIGNLCGAFNGLKRRPFEEGWQRTFLH